MELIQSENYQQLVHTFGQDNIDKLSAEDLELAYTIPKIDNISFEQLQTEIQKIKNSSAPPPSPKPGPPPSPPKTNLSENSAIPSSNSQNRAA